MLFKCSWCLNAGVIISTIFTLFACAFHTPNKILASLVYIMHMKMLLFNYNFIWFRCINCAEGNYTCKWCTYRGICTSNGNVDCPGEFIMPLQVSVNTSQCINLTTARNMSRYCSSNKFLGKFVVLVLQLYFSL